MKKGSTLILKGVIFLIALLVLAICIFVLPIGIATDKTNWYRPILMGLYVTAIPFFIALFQGYKILNFIDRNKAFSEDSLLSLKKIKYSAFTISSIFALGMPYIFWVGDNDDAPGVIAIAFVIIFASFVVGTFAGVLEKLIQRGNELKSENDLTV